MNKWTVLGIEKTKDKDIIKNAYRSRLVTVNPEDNPEGFKELRQAYEEAIYEADKDDDEKEEEIGGGLQQEISCLYDDFFRRIKVEEWQKILERDEFATIDQAAETRDVVLAFLMNKHFVPQCVYQYLVETFSIADIVEELSERFPKDFLEFVLNNANYKDPIDYELFDSENIERADEFIDAYYGLHSAVVRCNVEEGERLLNLIYDMDLYNPYIEVCEIRHRINVMNNSINTKEERKEKFSSEIEELLVKAKRLVEEYPNQVDILIVCGDVSIISEKYDDATDCYQKAKELEPDNYTIKRRMAEIYCDIEEYEKAKDIYIELLDENNYDEGAQYGLTRANNGLIEQYSEHIKNNPDDNEVKLKLVWGYYRNGMFSEAVELLESFEPWDAVKCEYYNLLGRNYMYQKEYEKALDNFYNWISAIEEIPEDDTSEEAVKNRSRFYYANFYVGECFMRLEKYEEARKYLNIAISQEHEFIAYAYNTLSKLEYDSGNLDECLKVCQKYVNSNMSYDAYMYMAKCFYDLNELGNAIDCLEEAIAIQAYYYNPYVMLLEIYWECEEIEAVQSVISRFERLGYENDSVEYYKARLLLRDGKNQESNEKLLKLLEKKGTQEATLSDDDYLNVYALVGTNYERMDQEENSLIYLKQGLECIPDDEFFVNRIAKVHHVLGNFEEECKCYDDILKMSESERYIKIAYEGKAAALSCMKKFEDARKMFETLEERFGLEDYYTIDHAELLVRMNLLDEAAKLMNKCADEYEYGSFVRRCLGNLCCFYGNEGFVDKAREVFDRIIAKQPDEKHIYRTMGYVYLDHEMYEEAKELFLKALELDTENEAYTAGLYLIAVSKTDDLSKPEYESYIDLAIKQVEDADYAYAYNKKAEVYRGLGKYEEALKYAELSVTCKRERATCFVEYHDGWCEMGHIYREMGEYDKARECYEKALEIFGHHQQYIDLINECKTK